MKKIIEVDTPHQELWTKLDLNFKLLKHTIFFCIFPENMTLYFMQIFLDVWNVKLYF